MREYWSNTSLADKIRGTDKLLAGSSKEWNEWEKHAKEKLPIRYWIAEVFLDKLQSIIMSPIDLIYNIKYYINNRWVTKTHCLIAHPDDIKPGSWRDEGDRFLPCLFNSLVEYVEVSLAQSYIAWSDDEVREKFKAPFYSYGWFKWRTWRNADAGIEYLNWAIGLTFTNSDGVDVPSRQAEDALEILELYNWWKCIYLNRPDSMQCSGLGEFYDMHPDCPFGDLNEDDRFVHDAVMEICNKIDEEYKIEDTKMLTRLINIRDSLWV